MILSDYHVHTRFSSDSSTPTKDMIEQAITLGMKQLCITEHHDIGFPSELIDRTKMDFQLDLSNYITTMETLRQAYASQIQLLTGVELGMIPEHANAIEMFAKRYSFDYIIGSTHIVDNFDPYYPEYYDVYPGKRGLERYFEVTTENIQCIHDFDALGHLDYVVRYHPNPTTYTPSDYMDYIDVILNYLIQHGKALEVNTSALKKGFDNPNPHKDILIRYRELGGELITVGSDAHTPDSLGYGFQVASELLQNLGYRYYAMFEQRIPNMQLL